MNILKEIFAGFSKPKPLVEKKPDVITRKLPPCFESVEVVSKEPKPLPRVNIDMIMGNIPLTDDSWETMDKAYNMNVSQAFAVAATAWKDACSIYKESGDVHSVPFNELQELAKKLYSETIMGIYNEDVIVAVNIFNKFTSEIIGGMIVDKIFDRHDKDVKVIEKKEKKAKKSPEKKDE